MTLKNVAVIMLAATLSGAAPATDVNAAKWLKDECSRVFTVYPLLMLTVMAEGPMNCGNPEIDEVVDCDGDLPASEKEAKAKRLKVRINQESMYQKADAACSAYIADKKSPARIDAAVQAIGEARKADSGMLSATANVKPAGL